jgi:uncharacterized protein YhhL (DUF1145 family)
MPDHARSTTRIYLERQDEMLSFHRPFLSRARALAPTYQDRRSTTAPTAPPKSTALVAGVALRGAGENLVEKWAEPRAWLWGTMMFFRSFSLITLVSPYTRPCDAALEYISGFIRYVHNLKALVNESKGGMWKSGIRPVWSSWARPMLLSPLSTSLTFCLLRPSIPEAYDGQRKRFPESTSQ